MADRDGILHATSIAIHYNTTNVATGTTVIPSNVYRGGFMIQNLGTNPLYVYFGTGATTATLYDVILKASTATADGSGGTVAMENGTIYTGDISVAGTSPTLKAVEFN